ncbi:MAG: protein kinase [Myxococcales bacterium]|nr:protein kinase [Myxococcales bacterium]
MDTVDRLAAGTLVGDDYVIERELARGGMGAVYVARQRSTGRLRALKVLQPSLLDQGKHVERFLQEARIGAAFRSAHVVEVIAAGVVRELGTPWLAMELLEGETLAHRVERSGPMALSELAQLTTQLGDALGAAHQAGVVHRDIKPENLFLCAVPSATFHWSLKVLDFGIAKVVQESRTSATATSSIGTPLWMAPEQTDAHGRIAPPTDVWALALVLFWAHTGRIYWQSANVEPFSLSAVLREMIIDPIEPASTRAIALGASMPPALDPWFARCLDRDPSRRFANGREACDALLGLLSSMHEVPVSAPVAFASTAAMPVVNPATLAPVAPIAPIASATPTPSPFAVAAPHAMIASAAPVVAPSGPPSERPPETRPPAAPAVKSSKATRALWVVAVLSMLGGLVGIGIALSNEFEFVGASQPERSRRRANPSALAQPNIPASHSGAPPTNALAHPMAPTLVAPSGPALAPPLGPAVVPIAQTPEVPSAPEAPAHARQRTRSGEVSQYCGMFGGALSVGYYVRRPPASARDDDRDAQQSGCRSFFALCGGGSRPDCPPYSEAVQERQTAWCCPR